MKHALSQVSEIRTLQEIDDEAGNLRASLEEAERRLKGSEELSAARERFDAPLLASNVSGEYALVKAAAKEGWIDEGRIVRELFTAIRRAGADAIITYFAKEYAAEAAAW